VALGEGGAAGRSVPFELGRVAALGLLALLVRIGAAARTAVIFNDGPSFLKVAGSFQAGDFEAALSHHYHPLYPLLTAAVAPVAGDLERAGLWVSVVAGSAAVLALYAFLRRAFDPRTAWIGGVLFALMPYAAMLSADVQSEGLYFALFLAALAALWQAIEEASPARAGVAGLLAGAAYLVRPEGIGLAAVGLVFGALLLFRGRWTVPVFARFSAALSLGVALLAGPYVVHLHGVTGEWMLTQKKSISDLARPQSPDAIPGAGVPDRQRWRPPPSKRPSPREASILPARIDFEPRSISALTDLALVSVSAVGPVIALLVGLGLHRARGRPGDRAIFLLVVLGLYGVVLYGLALNVGYLHRRHVLAPLLPLLGYGALGVSVLGELVDRLPRLKRAVGTRRVGVGLVLACVALVTLPKTLAPHREESLAARRAAEWLYQREDLVGPVAADKHRTAYYAGEAYVHLLRGGAEGDVDRLERAGARFLIVDEGQLRARPALERARPSLEELHRVDAAGRTAFVFDLASETAPPH
jgi:hypothetical protein